MAPMKRPAAASAASDAKRLAFANRGVLKQCSVIETAVLGATEFPKPVLAMLTSNLPSSLGVPKEERHPFQEKIIEMIGEVLTSVEVCDQKTIQDAETKLNEASAEKASREQAQEAAAATLSAGTEAVEAAKVALNNSVAACKVARAELSEAESAQKAGDVELEESTIKKATLESTVRGYFNPLKEGTTAEVKVKDIVAAVAKVCKEFAFDPSLLTSLPAALAKSPGDRGGFDAMVWQQVEDEFTKRIQVLEETFSSGEPAKAERAAKVSAANAELETATTTEASCKESLEKCKADLEEAKAGHKAALKAVAQFGLEMKQVEKGLESAKASLASLTGGALAAYKELLDYTAILPPAPEEPAATEEGAPAAEVPPLEQAPAA